MKRGGCEPRRTCAFGAAVATGGGGKRGSGSFTAQERLGRPLDSRRWKAKAWTAAKRQSAYRGGSPTRHPRHFAHLRLLTRVRGTEHKPPQPFASRPHGAQLSSSIGLSKIDRGFRRGLSLSLLSVVVPTDMAREIVHNARCRGKWFFRTQRGRTQRGQSHLNSTGNSTGTVPPGRLANLKKTLGCL